MDEPDRPDDERPWEGEADDLERASENVLGWPADDAPEEAAAVDERFDTVVEPPPFEPVVPDEAAGPVAAEGAPAAEDLVDDAPGPVEEALVPEHRVDEAHPAETSSEHSPGVLTIPPGYPLLEGEVRGPVICFDGAGAITRIPAAFFLRQKCRCDNPSFRYFTFQN